MHGRRLTGRHFEFEDGYATVIGDVTQMIVLARLDVWDRYLVCFVDSPNDCAAGKRLELDVGLFFEDAFAFGVRHAMMILPRGTVCMVMVSVLVLMLGEKFAGG